MATYTIKQGQTLFDVALQLYGDVTKVYELVRLNPTTIPNVLTRGLPGLTINYEVQTNEVARDFSTNGATISTQFPEYTSAAAAWSPAWADPFSTTPTA